MNGWEGQVLAIAVKELFDAVKTLGRDGFGRRDRALLSNVIRDLLEVHPNVARAEATLKALQAMGTPPSPDLFVALRMLDAVQKTRLLEGAGGAIRSAGPALTGSGSGVPPREGTGVLTDPRREAARRISATSSLPSSSPRSGSRSTSGARIRPPRDNS